MDVIYMDHLKQTFRDITCENEKIIREQTKSLIDAINRMKLNLQGFKTPDEAGWKVKRTVKGIADFVENYAKIELNAFDSVKQAMHLTKFMDFILHQLDATDKNQKDMYDNLVTVILNLDGVARVFTAKEATKTQGGSSSVSWETRKDISMDGQEKGKTEKTGRSTDKTKLLQQIEQLQMENVKLLTGRQSEIEDTRQLRERMADLERKNTELKRKLQQESDDKDNALNRLSKLAGNKMKVGNPDIADLSDPNRPLKLSEEFGELYCNEWTDALEYLQKKATQGKSTFAGYHTIHVHGRQLEVQEKGSIDLLLEVLKKCYAISKGDADYQRIAILNAVTGKQESDTKVTKGAASRTVAADNRFSRSIFSQFKFPEQEKDIRADDAHYKLNDAIREFQRSLGTQTIKYMPKIIAKKAISALCEDHREKNFENLYSLEEDKLRIYVDKCAQLCWLMRIQFPPVHLKFDIQGDFDGKFCTPYLTSGEKVLFPVWPAMFLHEENGALMRKGVVECTRKI
ncbi:hypothetical protein CHS0354_039861 [Potamilus streckersoni]|uniref:Mitochondria-eating protein C-terminal domain-containing protein n=1 Tax=Potamilus streckersoni TaxID=2493646 RepID=A0AAE0W0E9_9BIVA|nr:hypothetical protein CHS0354_039861 [Potamilus streckersoni]